MSRYKVFIPCRHESEVNTKLNEGEAISCLALLSTSFGYSVSPKEEKTEKAKTTLILVGLVVSHQK